MGEVVGKTIKNLFAPSFYRVWNDFYFRRKTTFTLAGGRGCVDGDTELSTPCGNVKVRDFNGGVIYAYDGQSIVETFACRALRYTEENLYRVELENGESVVCTDQHRFLTDRGWVESKNLTLQDFVFVTNQPAPSAFEHDKSDLSKDHDVSVGTQENDTSSSSQSQDLSKNVLLQREYVAFLRPKRCARPQSMSPEDALHSMRKLLCYLYHYWIDFRLCDGLPPLEEETYRDVLLRLVGAPGHTHDNLLQDDLDVSRNDSRLEVHGHHLSRLDCHLHEVDRCYVAAESETLQTLSGLLSESFQTLAQSHTIEDLDERVRQVSRRLLGSICSVDSLEHGHTYTRLQSATDSSQEVCSFRMLSDMLRRTVRDESLSDSFCVNDDVLTRNRQLKKIAVRKIEFLKTDYYYDLFVPFYNNYITSNGIINHNSAKSSFVAMAILLGLERDRREGLEHKRLGDREWRSYLTHAIAYRKVANTLADSVYTEFQRAAERLGLTSKYIFKKTPLQIERRGTGQRIMFRGLDDPQRSKSLKPAFSFFRYFWGEELAEYDGIEEILDVQRSVQRGGHDFVTFFSYNPPETSANWVNYTMQQMADKDPLFGFYKSDYRTVPREWLGDEFFRQAEILRRRNERQYRHVYLGEVTGNGGTVFPNVVERRISDEEIRRFDNVLWGCDFGLRDPTVLCGVYYDQLNHALYCFDEVYKPDMTLDDMEREFKHHHFGYEYIVADCAGATLITTLRARGLDIIPCKKGNSSIMNGIKWLQSLTAIYIDKIRCPNGYREFCQYEYSKNKAGEFTGQLPDRDNHYLDSVRYSTERIASTSSWF